LIYVTADLHGYPLEKFLALLNKAGFTDEDFLYVLGDVIDRGSDGAELLRWLVYRDNAELILGNHEAMLLGCEFLFQEVTEETLAALDTGKLELLDNWMKNGGAATATGLRKIAKEDGAVLADILDYLRSAPLWTAVSAGRRDYLLTHSGLGNFREDKKISSYKAEELLWNRPTLQERYFDEITVVFGHTPTGLFGAEYADRMLQTDTWIDIDTGSGHGGAPMLLRLDDGQAFYGE